MEPRTILVKPIWLIFIGLVLAAEIGSAAWRALAERVSARDTHQPMAQFQVPEGTERGRYRKLEIEAKQVGWLEFDAGERHLYRGKRGEEVEILCLSYREGNPKIQEDVLGHYPDLCARDAGLNVVESYPEKVLRVEGSPALRVRAARLGGPGQPSTYVFRGVWFPEESGFLDVLNVRLVRLKRALWLDMLPPSLIAMASVGGVDSYEQAEQVYCETVIQNLKVSPEVADLP